MMFLYILVGLYGQGKQVPRLLAHHFDIVLKYHSLSFVARGCCIYRSVAITARQGLTM